MLLRRKRRVGALVALAVLSGLFVPGSANAAETFEIQVYEDLFPQAPGFSARFYPGSVELHSGDTLHLSERVVLFPEGVYPQDFIPENVWTADGPYSFLMTDPDDGAGAMKIQEGPETDCGTPDNPCVWDGKGELLVPTFPEEEPGVEPDFSMWITVTAPPGTTMWASSVASSNVNTNLKVEVVGAQEPASTQASLDERAAELLRKDREDAAALHQKMSAKRTSHTNSAGQKVYDVWVGAAAGPIELFASYPRRISVPKGARVMYHFQDELEPHTATFGGSRARDLLFNGFIPACDPDGDEGAGPDTEPDFSSGEPTCTPPSALEFDVDPRLLAETGDGRVNGGGDLENSGLKAPIFPEETTYDLSPWTVRMTKTSNDKGFKYICLVHGGFMGGRVIVK